MRRCMVASGKYTFLAHGSVVDASYSLVALWCGVLERSLDPSATWLMATVLRFAKPNSNEIDLRPHL